MKRGGFPQAVLCVLLSALLVLLPRTSLALGPFEKNHPTVEEGLRAYEEGRFDDALTAFEAAKREMPDNAVVEFDRGNALYKLQRMEEAREAYHRVADMDRGDLQEKDYYNLGNALAELGQPKDAIAAYRKALLLDPKDELARHNLEVVLRNLPRPKRPQPQPDAGQDAGRDAGMDGGKDSGDDGSGADGQDKDGGQKQSKGQGGQDAGFGDGGAQGDGGMNSGPGDGGFDGGRGGDAPKKPSEDKVDAGSGPDDEQDQDEGTPDGGLDEQPTKDLNKKDVERLLDSMKQSEKNLQLWRFQQRKSSKSRKDNATKDW
ncbi:MAG TPA: tetratricopeptide repeat protein [Myxococcaceae bacterium]|jgi:tetratricopeptide (TPR) repeat protein